MTSQLGFVPMTSQLGFVPIILALVGAAATAAPAVMQAEAARKVASAAKTAAKQAVADANIAEGEKLLRTLAGYGIYPEITARTMSMADLEWLRSTTSQVGGMVWRKRLVYIVFGAMGAGAAWYVVGR